MPFLLGLLALALPIISHAADTPLGNAENFGEFISLAWGWGSKVIIGVSVVMLTVGGILYLTSNGDDEKISKAKDVISGSVVATVIVLFSGVIRRILQQSTAGSESGNLDMLPQTIINTANILLTVVGAITVIMVMLSALHAITAGGDIEKLEKAQKGMKTAGIGLLIALSAAGIINTIVAQLL